MKKIFFTAVSLLLLVGLFFVSSSCVRAETSTPYSELVDALNKETDEIYIPYGNLVKQGDTITTDDFIAQFAKDIETWKQIFLETKPVYEKYLNYGDSQIAEIAQKGELSNREGVSALNSYRQAFLESDESAISKYFAEGDATFLSAVKHHDEAVKLYNNYSGVSSTYSTRDFLIVFSILSAIFTIILFFKSRNTTTIEAEIIKAEIYRRLTKSALWMTVGLVVTTAGFAFSMNTGSSYYIFWGPVVFGGWELLKGLFNYFRNDRKVLAALASEQRGGAVKQSFFEDEVKQTRKTLIKCSNCGKKQSRHTIICKNCGNNLL